MGETPATLLPLRFFIGELMDTSYKMISGGVLVFFVGEEDRYIM
jgi:hypothetical protein